MAFKQRSSKPGLQSMTSGQISSGLDLTYASSTITKQQPTEGPYVRRMIATLGEPDLPVLVLESFHEQMDEELTENDIKRMDADDQAIQTILLGLPEDVYAAVDCSDFTQIYDFLKMNQDEFGQYAGQVAQNQQGYNVWQNGGIQVAQNAVQNSYQGLPIRMELVMLLLQGLRDLEMGIKPGATTTEDWVILLRIALPDQEEGMLLIFRLSCSLLKRKKQGFNFKQKNLTSWLLQIVVRQLRKYENVNQARCYNCRGLGHTARICTAKPKRRDASYLQTQLLIAQKEEVGIQLQAEEFDFMAAAGDLDEIEEVNANCILMANLQQASTSGTQLDKAPVYDTDSSAEVHLNDNCYDNEIFNMFTQEEQYTDLLEPITEPQLVPQNDNHVTSVAPSMVQSRGTIETSFAPNEETRAHQETVYLTMEILLEPTPNKLLVGDVGDSIWIELVTLDINLGSE
nr:hypothetical protein [Tanacetum cinerariifolium]